MRRYLALILLATAACVSAPSIDRLAAPAPVFAPERFFVGRTHGEGVLRVALRAPVRTIVDGDGRIERDGTVVLTQRVQQGDKPVRQRRWRIHSDGAGRYTGSLTDAEGAVSGVTRGNLLHLSFHMKGGLSVRQDLFLSSDGQSARNRMTVSKLGVGVAALDERIVRVR
jgi:hypothetical protein